MSQRIVQRFDKIAVGLARRYGIWALRISLGVVFIWFGALKVADASPVADLVADIVPSLSDGTAVMMVGSIEILVGIGLVTGWMIRLTLALFFAQMLGTFAVLIVQPGSAFEAGNPLRLTVMGEFVVKNLVLLTAGLLVAAGTIPPARREEGFGEMLTRHAEGTGEVRPRR